MRYLISESREVHVLVNCKQIPTFTISGNFLSHSAVITALKESLLALKVSVRRGASFVLSRHSIFCDLMAVSLFLTCRRSFSCSVPCNRSSCKSCSTFRSCSPFGSNFRCCRCQCRCRFKSTFATLSKSCSQASASLISSSSMMPYSHMSAYRSSSRPRLGFAK